MTPEAEVLADLLTVADALRESIAETTPLLGQSLFASVNIDAMSPVQRIAATALLKQFEQLEDTLNGLFRSMLRVLGVRLKGLYALDIGQRMTELGVIDEAEDWLAAVQLRNTLVHEYPLGSGERSDRVSRAFATVPFLLDAAARAGTVVAARGLLEDRS